MLTSITYSSAVMPHVRVSFMFVLCSYLIAHSFGRRMLYPGSVGLLQKAMRPMLQQGQARLVEEVTPKDNYKTTATTQFI